MKIKFKFAILLFVFGLIFIPSVMSLKVTYEVGSDAYVVPENAKKDFKVTQLEVKDIEKKKVVSDNAKDVDDIVEKIRSELKDNADIKSNNRFFYIYTNYIAPLIGNYLVLDTTHLMQMHDEDYALASFDRDGSYGFSTSSNLNVDAEDFDLRIDNAFLNARENIEMVADNFAFNSQNNIQLDADGRMDLTGNVINIDGSNLITLGSDDFLIESDSVQGYGDFLELNYDTFSLSASDFELNVEELISEDDISMVFEEGVDVETDEDLVVDVGEDFYLNAEGITLESETPINIDGNINLDGDLLFDSNDGVVLRSSNGNSWLLKVDDNGNLFTQPVDSATNDTGGDSGEYMGDKVLGDSDAPVTITMFAGFEDPYSKQFMTNTFGLIIDEYIESEDVLFVFKNYPLIGIQPNSLNASVAAECAAHQGKFWEYSFELFNLDNLDSVNYVEVASELGLDEDDFIDCLQDDYALNQIFEEIEEGDDLGITGTPTFFINDVELIGAHPFSDFQEIIDGELEG